MGKFKIGDTVQCVKNGAASKPHAGGYKPGKEFVVEFINETIDGDIYFPKHDNGVFECDLVLVKEVKEYMEDLIGKKVRGFKFEGIAFSFSSPSMNKHIGEIGTITRHEKHLSGYVVKFDSSPHSWMYPADQIEKHLVKELPKSFACTNTNQKLWDKYIEWLNTTYNKDIYGDSDVYPYYGITANGVYDCHKSIDYYDTILTLEEWDEIVNGTQTKKEETMKNYTITREQLKKIHDVACFDWKEKITEYAVRNPFGDTIEFTQTEVGEMFKAASLSQTAVLANIFGKQAEELNFKSDDINFKVDGISVFGISNMKSDESFIGLPRANHPNSFFLNPDYNWTLDDDVLKVTRK